MNDQQKEASRMNGMLTNQLNNREAHFERLQDEVLLLRHDLEKGSKELFQYKNLEKSRKTLDEMFVTQRSPVIKAGLGFKEDSR